MINFKLNPKDFNYLGTEYEVIEITKYNYKDYISLIEKTIQNFNNEIEWDKMFDLNEAILRLEDNATFYIGIINNEPFGHVWFEFIDTMSSNKFLYNLFIKNKVENKTYTGREFVSDIIFRFNRGIKIFCEVDEWNEKSIKLFEKLGFKRTK